MAKPGRPPKNNNTNNNAQRNTAINENKDNMINEVESESITIENTNTYMSNPEDTKLYEEKEELNLEQKVVVKSIAGWMTGFKRIESIGDVSIAPNGSVRLSRSEIIAQIQSGNKLLSGIDGQGSHATLYIDDAATREEVMFDDKISGRYQKILTPSAVRQLFAIQNIGQFEFELQNTVVTRAEKFAIIEIIKKERFNDFEKIRLVENYTGFKM